MLFFLTAWPRFGEHVLFQRLGWDSGWVTSLFKCLRGFQVLVNLMSMKSWASEFGWPPARHWHQEIRTSSETIEVLHKSCSHLSLLLTARLFGWVLCKNLWDFWEQLPAMVCLWGNLFWLLPCVWVMLWLNASVALWLCCFLAEHQEACVQMSSFFHVHNLNLF